MIKIVIFRTDNGKSPFVTWFNDLDQSEQGLIQTRLDRLTQGNFGDCKTISGGEGLRELRIDRGPGYRIYFGIQKKALVVVLAGGSKRSQQKDIIRAKKYWLECKDADE